MQDEKLNDSLLETIGRLYGRNQALQKGHATLTRRVRELEKENEQLKNSGYLAAGWINEGKIPANHLVDDAPLTAADLELRALVDTLSSRVNALEQTPATDAYLNSVRAEGAEAVAAYHRERFEFFASTRRDMSNEHKAAYLSALDIADRIRSGEQL